MVAEWHRNAPPRSLLFDVRPSEYAQALRWVSEFLGLCHVLTPHMLRHGGASCDVAHGARDLLGTQEHGQWASQRSVQRYKKTGVYQQVVAQLPQDVTDTFSAALRRLPGLLRMTVRGLSQRR